MVFTHSSFQPNSGQLISCFHWPICIQSQLQITNLSLLDTRSILYIDSFTTRWSPDTVHYASPPLFSLVSRVLAKIQSDNTTANIVLPLWPNQLWFLVFLNLLSPPIFMLPPEITFLPWDPERKHPMGQNLKLTSTQVSNNAYKQLAFQDQLTSTSWPNSQQVCRTHTMAKQKLGSNFAHNRLWIPILQL